MVKVDASLMGVSDSCADNIEPCEANGVGLEKQ
jgi:hypothetical protein